MKTSIRVRSLACSCCLTLLTFIPSSRAGTLSSSFRNSSIDSYGDLDNGHLQPVESPENVQPWWMKLFECVIFLSVVMAGYSYVMSLVQTMGQRNENLSDALTKMTVIVPHSRSVGSSSGSGSERDTYSGSSDESAALLSLKGWNYYESGLYYQSIASDLSDQSGDWSNEQDD